MAKKDLTGKRVAILVEERELPSLWKKDLSKLN